VPALFVLAFAESSFFPIPPDVLLVALALGAPRRALRFALICTVGSVLGGVAGYAIGWGFWEGVGRRILIDTYGFEDAFERVGEMYRQNAFLAVFTAAFTPIPYKVFTIAAGVFHDSVSLPTLVLASIVGRGARFFLVAGLIARFGAPATRFIDAHFNRLALLFAVLLVGGFVLVKTVL
jgi:membrane protein YqaA with SNARE-associated domain